MNKNELNSKLDLILKNQKKILENEAKILGEEEKIEELERQELEFESKEIKTEEDALNELKNLEKQIKNNNLNPIKNITRRDIFKGFVGAFVGVMSHFAFSKAADLAEKITVFQATVLYLVAFAIIIIMLYYTGFRNVKKHIFMKFMPLRAVILYVVSIITIIIVNLLFGKINFPLHFTEIYILVGTNIILAVMGAGTADLIGGDSH